MPFLLQSALLVSGLLAQVYAAPSPGLEDVPSRVEVRAATTTTDPYPVQTTGCYPDTVDPHFLNADFQQYYRNTNFNIDQPSNWSAEAYSNIRTVSFVNGNKVAQITAVGNHAEIHNYPLWFEPNACSKNRYYNVTFDLAVKQYQLANPKVFGNCSINLSTTADRNYRKSLASIPVGTTFQRQGPYIFDSKPVPRYGIQIRVDLDCDGSISANDQVVIWIDNFQFTQYGKNVTVKTTCNDRPDGRC